MQYVLQSNRARVLPMSQRVMALPGLRSLLTCTVTICCLHACPSVAEELHILVALSATVYGSNKLCYVKIVCPNDLVPLKEWCKI